MDKRYLLIISILISFILFSTVQADIELSLLATITIDNLDSAVIRSITPVGDFNADGHDDLLIGVYKDSIITAYEAAYLYYGGPDFDTQPDLIFKGEPTSIPFMGNYFGARAYRLNDFNGDGYDDLAITATGYPGGLYRYGKLYIHYGSPTPDTSTDLSIVGGLYYDWLGERLYCGDYNGDNYSDLYIPIHNWWYEGPRFLIFLGSDSPDNIYDWIIDSTLTSTLLGGSFGGSDINGDGYDDFGWDIENCITHLSETHIYLGDDTLSTQPSFTFDSELLIRFPGDISLDGIDDFIIPSNQEFYLYLGGNPLDFNPDYYMWNTYDLSTVFSYYHASFGLKLVRNFYDVGRLIFYDIGIPFNTIPYDTIFYDNQHLYPSLPSVTCDINSDGSDEIIMMFKNDSLDTYWVNIYTIQTTGIEDKEPKDLLPREHCILEAYPNPFNSSLSITFNSNESGILQIYDILGCLVREYEYQSGAVRLEWDACDFESEQVSSGVYYIRQKGEDSKPTAQRVIYLR